MLNIYCMIVREIWRLISPRKVIFSKGFARGKRKSSYFPNIQAIRFLLYRTINDDTIYVDFWYPFDSSQRRDFGGSFFYCFHKFDSNIVNLIFVASRESKWFKYFWFHRICQHRMLVFVLSYLWNKKNP